MFAGCVRPIGVSNGKISDSQLTSSSFKGGATPNLGRLYRMPKSGEMYSYWQPSDGDSNPYIQVNFVEESIITAIATQGHFDSSKREFATSYLVMYKERSNWKTGKVFGLNRISFLKKLN